VEGTFEEIHANNDSRALERARIAHKPIVAKSVINFGGGFSLLKGKVECPIS
jgi:hypothetical protein